MDRNDQAWAVFRCQLLAPVLLGEVPASERGAYFRMLSEQEQLLPNGTRKKISERTLRRWWKRLREGGVEATQRKRRSDRGQPHLKIQRAAVLARAVELKREQPWRSAHVINQILQHEFGQELPPTTLYRHFRRNGATRQKLGVSTKKVRCRWTRDTSNALWVGDFEHGPVVLQQGHAVKTHLSAWIDCHSRYIIEARYYVRENLDILVDSLLRAWGANGASGELYLDNAKIYHADGLKLACAQLNIRLLHRPPREPEPGGLIERFFQTLQGQFEAEVNAASPLSLNELNRAFQTWLKADYHTRVHSETHETPQIRFEAGLTTKRQVDLKSVERFFYHREVRTVNRDHADVQVDNQFFKAELELRGDRVMVEYDPFCREEDLQEVKLYDEHDVYLGNAKRYQRERGAHPTPKPPSPVDAIEPHYLRALAAKHETQHAANRQLGLDFHSAEKRNVWSFSSFATKLTQLLGRSGGLSSLTARELDVLQAFHAQHDRVTETLLCQAVAQADEKSVPQILWQFQILLQNKE